MCGCNECNGLTLFPGQDGVGILSITDNGNGTFTFLLTNGTTFTTSDLTGPVGPQGPTGATGATGTVLVTSIHDAGSVYGNTLQAIGAPSGYLFTKWDTIPDGSLFEIEVVVHSFNDVPPTGGPFNYLGFKFSSASEYIAFTGTTTPLIPIPNILGLRSTTVRITLTKKSATTAYVAMISSGDFIGTFKQGSLIDTTSSYGVASDINIGATSSERLVVYGLPASDGSLLLDRLTIKLYLND